MYLESLLKLSKLPVFFSLSLLYGKTFHYFLLSFLLLVLMYKTSTESPKKFRPTPSTLLGGCHFGFTRRILPMENLMCITKFYPPSLLQHVMLCLVPLCPQKWHDVHFQQRCRKCNLSGSDTSKKKSFHCMNGYH